MIKNFKWLFLVSLTFLACSEDDDVVATYDSTDGLPLTSGSADFSKYVALGDSFAAGFSDNALFIEGQKGAYPNILAQQFSLVGGGAFTTPFMNDNNGGFIGGTTRLAIVGTNPDGTPAIGNVPFFPTTDPTVHLTGSFNNMGIPGARAIHLDVVGYAGANPYFGRFASTAASTVVDDANAQNPTFFSLWIGGNDVLQYATSGGDGSSPITPTAAFDAAYTSMINKLTVGGRKGVIANLPYVSTLPYFRTVPYNPLPLDAPTIALLMNTTTGYGQYNNALLLAQAGGFINAAEVARRTIGFTPGAGNKVVIVDSYLTNLSALGIPSYRQTTSEDLVVLPARSFIGTQVGTNPQMINGVSVPLADKWVLSKEEILEVQAATDAYNTTIQAASTSNGLAFVDAKAIMNQLNTPAGITGNNFTLTANFVTGGTFSLDGVHPSPRGYALIANKFIEAINLKYGSNMKGVNLGNYRILFPVYPSQF